MVATGGRFSTLGGPTSSRQRNRCGLNVRVVLRGAQHVMRVQTGPAAKVKTELTLKGISGAARGYRTTRKVGQAYPFNPFDGFFPSLRLRRYRASAFYPGDGVRQRSRVAKRLINVRCASSRAGDRQRKRRGSR